MRGRRRRGRGAREPRAFVVLRGADGRAAALQAHVKERLSAAQVPARRRASSASCRARAPASSTGVRCARPLHERAARRRDRRARAASARRSPRASRRPATTSSPSAGPSCDVTDEEAVAALFDAASAPSTCSSTTPASPTSAPLARTTLESWRAQLDVNATGAFLCTRAVLAGHARARRGRDRHRRVDRRAGSARRYTAAYTASKHAAVGLMRAVAAEVAGTGVDRERRLPDVRAHRHDARVGAPHRRARPGRSEAESEAALAAASPLGRLLEPERGRRRGGVPRRRPRRRAINGQTMILDGGGIQA